eukprot:TRINITY_DN6357_c2_g3_i1.p2 TRINITY_DN6357_c2_g3~~TRINITY_DN6357_c2_g3_i1.p2  ORF type:complete len:285 (-),score=91.66 TRINITY_DN6357_c2_g3_i1:256-1041(-)
MQTNNTSNTTNGTRNGMRNGQPPVRIISPSVNQLLNPKCMNNQTNLGKKISGGKFGYPHVPTSEQPTNLQYMSGWPFQVDKKEEDQEIKKEDNNSNIDSIQIKQEVEDVQQQNVNIQAPKKQENVKSLGIKREQEIGTESLPGTESGLTSMQQDDADEDLDLVTVDSDDLEEFDEDELGLDEDQGDGFEDVQGGFADYDDYDDGDGDVYGDYGVQYNTEGNFGGYQQDRSTAEQDEEEEEDDDDGGDEDGDGANQIRGWMA